jgi:hypothetical protein
LPTFAQAKKVAWYPIISLIPPEWLIKDGINKSEMCISTIFGSKIYVVGMDKPHRLEGITPDGVVIDESSDQRPGMFERTIVPMLSPHDAWCWRIGVPKKTGIGRVEFRDFFMKGLANEGPDIKSFTWPSSDVWTAKQIEAAKLVMDDETYEEQCNAVWLESGGSIYHAFKRLQNVTDVYYDDTKDIVVGCDFNVSPMCWMLGHLVDGKLLIFGEVFLKDTNTGKTLDYLYNKYIGHKAGWRFVGDASANSRKTSSSRSDYFIIKNDSRFQDKTVFFPKKNPDLRNRWAAVNAALHNAKGDVRILIDPKCKHLINDLNSMSYKEGTSECENYSGTDIGHMSDGLGYAVMRCLPMKLNRTAVPEVYSWSS